MSILGSLLGYVAVKGICKEVRIADQKYMDRKLKEIEIKYTGGKYNGSMFPWKPRWDEYVREVNPLRIKLGMMPLKSKAEYDKKNGK